MIPIDVDHRRSEATLGVDILTKVVNIVNQNDTRDRFNIIPWVFPRGARGAPTWSMIDQVGLFPALAPEKKLSRTAQDQRSARGPCPDTPPS